ncbi:hypothetical protein PINS_up013334 [Pythium insidiosum]|nr:hypothetical protein PINS_up013334 [Pythium insidiosum]
MCSRCRRQNERPTRADDTVDECRPQEDALADDVMQQELVTLRQALAELQRQQHQRQHLDRVSQQLDAVSLAATEELHVRQAREIELLELQANEADATIAALQAQLRDAAEQQAAIQQRLETELRQLQTALRHCEQAGAAESEILRRRVETLERQNHSREVELSSLRREADGTTGRNFREVT